MTKKIDKKLIGVLASGQEVMDRPNRHFDDTLLETVILSLGQISLSDSDFFVEKTVNIGKEIGLCKVVSITKKDSENIFYAIRSGRTGYSKFVKNREPKRSKDITIVLSQTNESKSTYIIITAYIGKRAGLEPYDSKADESDIKYWKTHAFIPEITKYEESTVTLNPPKYFLK